MKNYIGIGLGSFVWRWLGAFLGLDEHGDVTEDHRFRKTPQNASKLTKNAFWSDQKIRVPKLENDEKQNFTKLPQNVPMISPHAPPGRNESKTHPSRKQTISRTDESIQR